MSGCKISEGQKLHAVSIKYTEQQYIVAIIWTGFSSFNFYDGSGQHLWEHIPSLWTAVGGVFISLTSSFLSLTFTNPSSQH